MNSTWQSRRFEESKTRRNDHRSPYQRDRARILHSSAFRRLQAKTQIHGVGSSDFYRTRLTHSLEAAQIGAGIHAQLSLRYESKRELLGVPTLVEALCLAHDLGHPPFGHGGEVALHYMMREHGGFEGNGQTFRIVTTLEPYTERYGMNLARRTLLGLVKYPVHMSQVSAPMPKVSVNNSRELKADDWHPAKALYDCDQPWFNWMLDGLSSEDAQTFTHFKATAHHSKAQYKSFDCSIMELADDIAYAIHDLEDAITLELVSKEQWSEAHEQLLALDEPWITAQLTTLTEKLFSRYPYERKDAIGAWVNYFITSSEIRDDLPFAEPLLSHNAYLPQTAAAALKIFKQFVYKHVIRSYPVQSAEYKGQQMIMALFEAYASDPRRLLPKPIMLNWRAAQSQSEGYRVIADWISSLTDQSAKRVYQELFI